MAIIKDEMSTPLSETSVKEDEQEGNSLVVVYAIVDASSGHVALN